MIIDVHGHITSPELLARFPMPPALGDIDGMLEGKQAAGITTTIVGSPVGAGTMVRMPGLDNYRQPLDALRRFHEWVGEQVRARPGSLRAYAYANPLGDAESLEHAAELLRQEEFVGLIANTSVNSEFLDSPRAGEFFALADEYRAPVMLHPPAEPAAAPRDLRLVEHVARPCDVTIGVASVLGWLERYPNLRIIAPLAGGALPLLVEKIEAAYRTPAMGPRPPAGTLVEPVALPPRALLQQVYVDTATPSPDAVALAIKTFGIGNVLLGTDSPPLTGALARMAGDLGRLGLDPADRARIERDNARELFGLAGELAPAVAAGEPA